MTQEERNLLYDIAYKLDSLHRFSWHELARAIKQFQLKGNRRTVVMNGDVIERMAERIRDIAERDGARLISQGK